MEGAPPTAVGRTAFEAHFAALSGRIQVGDDTPDAREAAAAISKARQWVESGDYLAALHAIGGLEVRLALSATPGAPQHPKAGDVEQALGDLRREIARSGDAKGTAEASRLFDAAREEVMGGAWEAALALMDEARGWLARGRR